MSKRKQKKQRKSPLSWPSPWGRRPSVDLEQAFEQADRLIGQGRAQAAIELLEPLLASYPQVAELHYYLGYARVKAGDLWGGLAGYEQASELSSNRDYSLPLASLYLELELYVPALQAFRRVLKQQPDAPMIDQVRQSITILEQDLQTTADQLKLPVAQVEKGLYHLHSGQLALHTGNFPACIAANRQAIKLLPGWPPPYNNLSLALFFDGQPKEAIATAYQVLANTPQNVQALSNAIRFLTWTNQEAEARALWTRLQVISPQDNSDRLKMAEAAGLLNEDEQVYQLLKPLDSAGRKQADGPAYSRQVQFFLAVAEANMGRPGAQQRFKELQPSFPWLNQWLVALKAKRPGPGWAERFPYFHSSDLMTRSGMEEFINLTGRKDKLAPQKFRSHMERFVARFPQMVQVAEKMIWEDQQASVGVAMLTLIATPAAYAALRRFGLSQAGPDQERMQVLLTLVQTGQIAQNETVRVWNQGEWREVQLRQYEISDEPKREYSTRVADLLEKATLTFQRKDEQQAERLFRRVLELEPRAKEAYNNLGAIYSHRGEVERAKEMFQAALAIDPIYVFPRCNLALYLLNDEDIEGAQAMLAPLAEVKQFHPQEVAFYSYLQARLAIHRKEYEAARNALEAALQILPDYQLARDLLEHLERVSLLDKGFHSFIERQNQRNQANRARLQTKLTHAAPSLAETLALYSKDVLTGMARLVIPWGGWSGLHKAELLQQIVSALTDRDQLPQVVSHLTESEQAALRQVLAEGGNMAWSDFTARYDHDLEESPYWNWHTPETTMGRLRLRGLLAEATVAGILRVVVPAELRGPLGEILG